MSEQGQCREQGKTEARRVHVVHCSLTQPAGIGLRDQLNPAPGYASRRLLLQTRKSIPTYQDHIAAGDKLRYRPRNLWHTMTSARILQLIELIPIRVWTLELILSEPYEGYRVQSEFDRLSQCLNSPNFGWRFIKTFREQGLPLPDAVTEQVLRDAYAYESGQPGNPATAQALALEQPAMKPVRDLLRALLIVPDLPLLEISQKLNLPVEVIDAYSELFWNVRDRLQDKSSLVPLVYPRGRIEEFEPEYLKKTDPGMLLLRAAWNHGAESALKLAGYQTMESTMNSNLKAQYDELEALIVANGLAIARWGGIHQENVPALKAALSLLKNRNRRQRKAKVKPVAVAKPATLQVGTLLEELQAINGRNIVTQATGGKGKPASAGTIVAMPLEIPDTDAGASQSAG